MGQESPERDRAPEPAPARLIAEASRLARHPAELAAFLREELALLEKEHATVLDEKARQLAAQASRIEELEEELRQEAQRRRVLEEDLKEAAEHAEDLYQNAPCGYHALAGDATVLRINDTELKWLGYAREEVVGVKRFPEIVTPEGGRLFRQLFPELKRSGEVIGAEFELMGKGGRTTPVLVNAIAVRDAHGAFLESRATLFPMGALKQAQRALAAKNEELKLSRVALLNLVDDLNRKSSQIVEANERLKDLDRLKSMFIASMSHELRTPLNSVIGFSSILLNEWVGPLNQEQRENLETVLRSGKHLLALVNDVIDVSKIEAGQVERTLEHFDLHGLIGEVASLLESEIRERGLDLEVHNVHRRMLSDRRRLLQCLINVLGNAVKYTEKGRITVSARSLPREAGEAADQVEIIVEDTGVGIREEEMGRLFNPFARMHSHLRSSVLGTGLGLYLTRKLLQEVLEGSITAQSVYGEGSRFTIRLPVTPSLDKSEAP